nr:hypothetical transcript [Hymenolepis microstoma]
MMLETFSFPYSINIDSGDGNTRALSIYNGSACPQGILRRNLAFRDFSGYRMKMCIARGYNFSTSAERDSLDLVAKKCSYSWPSQSLFYFERPTFAGLNNLISLGSEKNTKRPS